MLFAEAPTGNSVETTSRRCQPAALSGHLNSEACKIIVDGNGQQLWVDLESDIGEEGDTKL